MTHLFAKYRTIFVLCVAERLTYRSDFFLGTLMRFLPIVTTIFLWGAIFAGSNKTVIAGLTRDGVVAYYLLAMISRAFSSMPGLAVGIASDVREGMIKKYLTQPVSMIGFLMTMRVAHKLVYYSFALLPFVIVFYFCRGYFDTGWPPTHIMCAYVASLLMGFLIGFLFETLVGLLSFWVLEISSFSFMIIALNYVLSGHMFPLDLFPEPYLTMVQWLPFQYLAYFPATVFLHGADWSTSKLLIELTRQAGCAAVLFLMVLWAFRRGVRRYSAYGG